MIDHGAPNCRLTRRTNRLQDMAGKAHMGPDSVVDHVAYSSRTLREKIHAPLRATQVGGDQMAWLLERVQNGDWADHIAMAGEMFQAKELDEVFTNTRAAALLLENVPMIKLIKGIPEIAAKGESITPEDVRAWAARFPVLVLIGSCFDGELHAQSPALTTVDDANHHTTPTTERRCAETDPCMVGQDRQGDEQARARPLHLFGRAHGSPRRRVQPGAAGPVR